MSRDNAKVLKKKNLKALLENLLKDHIVFGPVRKGKPLLFDRIKSADDIVLGPGNTMNSPKDSLFPQTEKLFIYGQAEAGININEPSKEEKDMILFGVRPCDARGIVLLDKVFGESPQDPYYGEKRARTAIVSMACEKPDPKCFCLAVGSGPCSAEGSDLILVDLGDRYLAKAGNPKGIAFLKNTVFEEADHEDVDKAGLVEKEAENSMRARSSLKHTGTGEAFAKKLESLFEDPIWDDITESCLGCGICTYLCPTCHCFDILDEVGQSTGERIRVWDSCQFPLFTHQASGVNPRPSAKERFRQRIMHKLCYLPQNGNLSGCVGCGRCVAECPVNLDIREVIQKISAREAQ
jgi:ferredoxin